jgi:hypothetical protein
MNSKTRSAIKRRGRKAVRALRRILAMLRELVALAWQVLRLIEAVQ